VDARPTENPKRYCVLRATVNDRGLGPIQR
jgi:hypothetical protein